MQVILDSLFARPGSAPIWGGKKGEFRDWTNAPINVKPEGEGVGHRVGILTFSKKNYQNPHHRAKNNYQN